MIPKFALYALYRRQITDFLGLSYTTSSTKTQLINHLYGLIESSQQLYMLLLQTFPDELAMGPNEVQQVLGCTTTERKRWIYEGKLPVFYYRTVPPFRITYPMHERALVLRITHDEVNTWRAEYEQALQDRQVKLSRVRYMECLDPERVSSARTHPLNNEHSVRDSKERIASALQLLPLYCRFAQGN